MPFTGGRTSRVAAVGLAVLLLGAALVTAGRVTNSASATRRAGTWFRRSAVRGS